MVLRDAERTAYLQSRGLRVLRFTNVEVLTEMESVLESIYGALSEPSPYPLPEGEGKTGE